MANEVPESVSVELPRPPAPPRERPSLVAAPEPSPEERHGVVRAAVGRALPPEGSAEAKLNAAAEEALSSAAFEGALGIMTYGRSAARLGRTAAAQRSLARNPSYPAHALKRRTGYERGLFGLGVETHGDASFRPSALFAPGGAEGRLSDLAYMHRDVAVAYPGMSGVKVKIVPDSEWAAHVEAAKSRAASWSAYSPGAAANGFTVHGGDMAGIYVRGWRPGEPMDVWFSRADSTLVHEMQHVAQGVDGLRPPYAHTTRDAYLRDAREVDARNSAYRRLLTGDERYAALRSATQDVPPEMVNLDDKGGDNYGTFRNFLASDDVPETLFGIPIVQDESAYTESDIEFFRRNPKAAGFYDMGDENTEDTPRQAAKAKSTRGKYPGLTNNPGNVQKHELRTDKTLFEGEDGGGVRPKRFSRFTDPVLGLKAAAVVLAGYANAFAKDGKKFTIENYAPIYAPRNENNTEAYIRNISRYSGIARDAEIDRWDVKGLARMLKAKVRFETSPEASEWFTDEEYEEAAEKLREGAFD